SIVIAIGISFYTIGVMLLSLAAGKFSWVGEILKFTPFFGNSSVTSSFTAPIGDYMQMLILGGVWTVGLLVLTFFNFRKAELR
ncbi:MAG: hypothetical protein RR759_09445, partial [Ruthenibacterium sp.]